MKSLFIISLLICSLLLLAEETSPLMTYYNNPNLQTFQAAWQDISAVLEKDSTQINLHILLASLATSEARRLEKGIKPHVSQLNTGGKFQYANLLFSQARWEEAIGLYDQLNRSTPKWSCPWRHKGAALYHLKRFKDAEKALQEAVNTNEQHYDAYIWLAKAQYELKKYKPALKNLETALTLDPLAEGEDESVMSEQGLKDFHALLKKKAGKK